jgi:hypothetical protein
MANAPQPTLPLIFKTTRLLVTHLVKHVLLGREERWRQILPAQLIDDAREDYLEHAHDVRIEEWTERVCKQIKRAKLKNFPGSPREKSTVELALAYEDYAANWMEDRVKFNTAIAYLTVQEPVAPYGLRAWEAQAWNPRECTFMAARWVLVEDDRYYIKTCYRFLPKLRGKNFDRKVAERLSARLTRGDRDFPGNRQLYEILDSSVAEILENIDHDYQNLPPRSV